VSYGHIRNPTNWCGDERRKKRRRRACLITITCREIMPWMQGEKSNRFGMSPVERLCGHEACCDTGRPVVVVGWRWPLGDGVMLRGARLRDLHWLARRGVVGLTDSDTVSITRRRRGHVGCSWADVGLRSVHGLLGIVELFRRFVSRHEHLAK
jgi:hypothetical protein